MIILHNGIRLRHKVWGLEVRLFNPAPWQQYKTDTWEEIPYCWWEKNK